MYFLSEIQYTSSGQTGTNVDQPTHKLLKIERPIHKMTQWPSH